LTLADRLRDNPYSMADVDVEEASARRVGTTLKGKWVLEQLIGVGGMASVYAGRHKIGRLEAIKILHAGVAASPQLRARFEQEAHAVNSFRHPGVVEVRDIDTADDGSPYLVMELLDGESLGARMRRDPPLALADVLRIASETLDVLAAAHARAIVHRDIKPDNLFITTSGAIKVLDFGIARVRSSDAKAMLTKQGVTLGTMAYMPPEQARGEEIDGRADLFAVGATMFRVLAKRLVHDAASEAERVMKVLGEPAPSLATVAPSVPADVVLVVDRALAYDRNHRYPDAATMKADVDALIRGQRPPFAGSPSNRDAPTRIERASPPQVQPAPIQPAVLPTRVSAASGPTSSSKDPIATPYRLSPPSAAPSPSPSPSPFVLIGIGAAAVLGLLTLIAIVFFALRAAR
jgi:eukaryotic-like serine/threonine-protein kinase